MTKLCLIFLMTLFSSLPAVAQTGDLGGSGGDPREEQFVEISQNIAAWIDEGGAQLFKFPDQSQRIQYEQDMLQALSIIPYGFKKQQDPSLPCRFEELEKVILCDPQHFDSMSVAERYTWIHHSYAIAAKIEFQTPQLSKNSLSVRLSSFLQYKTIWKLSLSSASTSTSHCSHHFLAVMKKFKNRKITILWAAPFYLVSPYLGAAGTITTVAYSTIKSKRIRNTQKLLSLIQSAEHFIQTGEKTKPFIEFKATLQSRDLSISNSSLAQIILNANQSGALCVDPLHSVPYSRVQDLIIRGVKY